VRRGVFKAAERRGRPRIPPRQPLALNDPIDGARTDREALGAQHHGEFLASPAEDRARLTHPRRRPVIRPRWTGVRAPRAIPEPPHARVLVPPATCPRSCGSRRTPERPPPCWRPAAAPPSRTANVARAHWSPPRASRPPSPRPYPVFHLCAVVSSTHVLSSYTLGGPHPRCVRPDTQVSPAKARLTPDPASPASPARSGCRHRLIRAAIRRATATVRRVFPTPPSRRRRAR